MAAATDCPPGEYWETAVETDCRSGGDWPTRTGSDCRRQGDWETGTATGFPPGKYCSTRGDLVWRSPG